MLRPKECVLAGASGTHTVCVCTNHHNFKLMLLGANLKSLKLNDKSLISYKDFLDCIKCVSPSESCHLRQCNDCPGTEQLKQSLEDHLANEFVDHISYKQWVQVDRCTLDDIMQPVDEFIEVFIDKLKKQSPHDYIAKKQSEYFRSLKGEIHQGEVLVIADFSENYGFVIQDSVQGMHWNNAQATIHPFACYYRPEENSDVQTLNFVVISDDLNHNTALVHFFQKLLIEFLKTEVPNFRKVIYMSDGAVSQYKNRFNIMNVCLHEKDFGIPAEWHFYATSHGKGPSDGLGGTLKRLATRTSLQRPFDNQLQTPEQLYHWAKDNISGMQFSYASKTDIAILTKMLNKRFHCSTPITGIRSFHACLPRADGHACMKIHSFSKDETQFHVLHNWDKEDTTATAVSDLPRVTRSSKRKKCTS